MPKESWAKRYPNLNSRKVAEWRIKHPDRYRKVVNALKEKRYRIRVEQARRPPPELCEACGEPQDRKDLVVLCFDHDHKTGKFRGWLCNRCNSALGFADDNVQRLMLLIAYLNKNNSEVDG
jgi:hypothetical protein